MKQHSIVINSKIAVLERIQGCFRKRRAPRHPIQLSAKLRYANFSTKTEKQHLSRIYNHS